MAARSRFPALLVSCVAALALAACGTPRRTTCGTLPEHGGPPTLATRDAELCEAVRLRVAEHLGALPDLAPEQAELLRDLTWRWEDARTVDALLHRIREDAGEAFAAAVARAVDEVRAHGTRPMPADCADAERCLVKGAALGARITLDTAAAVLRTFRRRTSQPGTSNADRS